MLSRNSPLVVVSIAWLLSAPLQAQKLLIRSSDAPASDRVTVQTAGARVLTGDRVNARFAALPQPAELLVVLAPDALVPGSYDQVRTFLTGVYQAVHDKAAIQVAIQGREGLRVAPPFRTSAELQSVLRKSRPDLTADVAPSTVASNTADELAALSEAGLAPGSEWPLILYISHPNPIPAAAEEYAAAYLSKKFLEHKFRISFWDPQQLAVPSYIAQLARNTAGAIFNSFADVGDYLSSAYQTFALDWEAVRLTRGFDVVKARVNDIDAGTALNASSAAALPGIAQYAELREKTQSAATAPTGSDAKAVHAALDRALEINPLDRAALAIALRLAETEKDTPKEAAMLGALVELDPDQGALWAKLGDAQYRQSEYGAAEGSLLRAKQFGAGSAAVSEKLGRIYFSRKNFRGAGIHLDESLKIDPTQQDLWFLAAEAAGQLADASKQSAMLEKGLALGGMHTGLRVQLIEIYLARNDVANATRHVDLERPKLTRDAAVLSQWAQFYDRLARPDDALVCWKEAVQLDPKREPAHYAVVRNLLDRKQYDAALAAAAQALDSVTSSRIQTLKGVALDGLGRIYEARNYVESIAGEGNEIAFAKLRAELADRFGGPAGAAYRQYAEKLAADKNPALQITLDRGWRVSLREADSKNADWFASQLRPPASSAKNIEAAKQQADGVWLPGAMDALMFVARGSAGVDQERFLVEYSRTLLTHERDVKSPVAAAYQKLISTYFEQLKQLLAMGVRQGNQTVITLSLADKPAAKQTEAVINLLGWKLKRNNQHITLESGVKASQSQKQDLPAALAIDQSGIEAALASGKPYRLEIPWEQVHVVLDERTWRGVLEWDKLPGGIFEGFSRDMNLPKLYIAFSSVDRGAANSLLSYIGIKTLSTKYADRLSFYSSALAVAGGRVVVPGGPAADAVWTGMCGVRPSEPTRFFRALFDKDDGKLLTYFYTLSQLDAAHQHFFTLNSARTSAFYQLFADSLEMQRGAGRFLSNGSFADFFREIPLVDGAVDFPGSAEVWMVAKGRSKTAGNTQRLMKKVRKAVAPELEDEVLLRIARTKYKAGVVRASELDNFLAVSRIEAHRQEPLDDDAALLLAQNYAAYSNFYPYFSVFRTLTTSDFQAFFTFAGKLDAMSDADAELAVGQFHSLIEITRLGLESGRLSDSRAAEVFRSICARFQAAPDSGAYALASVDTLRDLMKASQAADADASLAEIVLGHVAPATFDWNGAQITLDAAKSRSASYARVLDLQKAGSIEALLRIEQAARSIIASPASGPAQIAIMERESARFPSVELPKNAKGTGIAKRTLERAVNDKVPQVVAKIRQTVAKKKVNLKDVEKLYRDLLVELAPHLRLALAGVVYAAYLSPDDALVADDPLLLRRHQFIDLFVPDGKRERFNVSELKAPSGAQGSLFSGGFAQFGPAAGIAASVGIRKGSMNAGVFANEIASIRMSPWPIYRDTDQQLLGLRLRMAREWCVYSADDPAVLAALTEDTAGILSLNRRRDLLSAIESRNWKAVWVGLSLSDLYFLSDRYLARYPKSPWNSPVDTALRSLAAHNDGAGLRVLGGLASSLAGCNHPHLQPFAPYEEYERHMFPAEMAERVSEIKLYLSQLLDEAALPASVLPAIAETAARRTFAGMQMSDERDWAGALKAYRKMDRSSLSAVLDKP